MDTTLLETLELRTPDEQKAMLTLAEHLKIHRERDGEGRAFTEALIAELPITEPRFSSPDEGLSPARRAARRFMRENPTLMRLLAQ